MPKQADVARDFREVFEEPHRFSALLEERLTLKAQMKEAEERLKQLDSAISELMTEHDATRVQYGDNAVSLVEGSRSNLSKEKLVEHGVPVSVIADCTTVTKYSYVLVR